MKCHALAEGGLFNLVAIGKPHVAQTAVGILVHIELPSSNQQN